MNNKNLKSILTAVSTTVFGISGLLLVSSVKVNAFEAKTESSPKISKSLSTGNNATNSVQKISTTQNQDKVIASTKVTEKILEKEVSNSAGVKNSLRGSSGTASWYGPGFHGRRTASGEKFNQNALTAAHRSLPFGTKVRVTNMRNGRSVIVRINDRGPFSGGRIIDLSRGAARAIGMVSSGTAPVRLEVLR